MVENLDENLGRLMAKLAEWRLLTNTVVVFLSDNGSAGDGLGQGVLGHDANGRPLLAWNAGMKGLKNTPDEGGVRVPCFIRWDGRFPANRDVDTLAAHLDLFPTLAALAQAPIPTEQVEGRSLLPFLLGTADLKSWPDRHLFTHVGRWPVGANPDQYQWKDYAVRTQQYRLVNDALYDLLVDPGQSRDLAAARPEIVRELKAAFEGFWREARPLMVNEGVPMAKVRPFWAAYERQRATSGIPEWAPPEF